MTTRTLEDRLQRLLSAKEKQEQVLEIEMARIEQTLNACLATEERWQRIKEQALRALREARQRADLDQNARYSAYLPHVRAQIRRCCSEGAALKEARARVRERLNEVMQSRKMLEKYRERVLREFAARHEKAEERALDAHALRKFLKTS